MASTKRQSRKSFYIQVGQQVLILDVHISPHAANNSLISGKKQAPKRSYDWFKKSHLLELLKSLEKVVAARVYSNRPVTRATHEYIASLRDITTQNLKIQYSFKKRSVTLQQFALLKKEKIYHLNGKTRMKDKINYDSLSFFHEKLVATVKQLVTGSKQPLTSLPLHESTKDQEMPVKNDTSSNYFAKPTDTLITSAVKRKKTSLKKMAKKSKKAMLKLSNESLAIPPSSFQEQNGNNAGLPSCHTDTESMFSMSNSSEVNSEQKMQKTFIDLEEEPKGLQDVRRVEDLQNDHLKFLINKMEEYLRSIFRGEVYCRRHEEYKNGGKSRDNLNFQVGMAHFSEDQHDCIMDALVAMFCYKHVKYLDYVTKVMLPEALIKLYQDIHKTTFDQAEECLLNDTVF